MGKLHFLLNFSANKTFLKMLIISRNTYFKIQKVAISDTEWHNIIFMYVHLTNCEQ